MGFCCHCLSPEGWAYLHALHRTPPLGALLVSEGVIPGRVQDGDADATVGIDVGVEDLGREAHPGRVQGVILKRKQ